MTKRQLLDEILKTARGTDGVLPNLVSAGKIEEMMTLIFSMSSEMNAPNDLVRANFFPETIRFPVLSMRESSKKLRRKY